MYEYKSKVYIQTDEQNRIIRCEGGYTTPQDLTGWMQIDEGVGDKFNLCQSHYFEGGLYAMDGICRYKYVDGAATLRTDAEIEADRAAIPDPPIDDITALQLAVAELAETQSADQTANELAMAEIAEVMIGG